MTSSIPTEPRASGGERTRSDTKGDDTLRLVDWDDLAEWQKDNHYIRTHYRPASNSYNTSLLSLAYLHNESFNIHSHLLGSSIFASLFAADLLDPVATTAPFATFYLGAMACLVLSSSFHTISNHSAPVCTFANALDYVGIIALIWGSFVPSLYYGFACHPRLRDTYIGMISVIGSACLYMSLKPKFRTPSWRPFRSAMFVAMGLSAVFPVLHGLKIHGWGRLDDGIGLRWLIGQGALYVAGAAIYAARVPERWRPGGFDVWGNSHQIFHVLVVVAAIVHLKGLTGARAFHAAVPAAVRCSV